MMCILKNTSQKKSVKIMTRAEGKLEIATALRTAAVCAAEKWPVYNTDKHSFFCFKKMDHSVIHEIKE